MLASDRIVEAEIDNQVVVRINKSQSLLCTTSNQASISSSSKNDGKLSLPIVHFKEIAQRAVNNFALPKEYIRSNVNEEKIDESHVEYDMDEEDYVWLKMANERRRKQKMKPISESVFEQAMDRLEKESHFQSFENGEMAWQSSMSDQCCICNESEDSNYNQIIYCDLCNIAVHQECYGVPYIPEGQWLCRRCQLSPSEPVRCVLCPYADGAYKQTSDGQWAHVICALWLNEVHFSNAVFLEPIEGVEFSLKRRHKLRCLVCKQPKVGACLQCSKKSCTRSFHVTCAYFAGMCMMIEPETNPKTDSVIINRYVFCHQHFPQKGEQSKIPSKRILIENLKKARKLMNSQEQRIPHISVPVIPSKKVAEIKKSLSLQTIDDLCHYWALKRKSRCGVPLIRRLQVYHNNTKTSIPQKQPMGGTRKVNCPPEFSQSISLRTNLEKVRLLCELAKKREKLKLEHVITSESLVDNCMKPVSVILEETLIKLISKDHMNKMQSRLENGDYKKVADLRADFNLMMDNCAQFNRDNPFFWNYGHRIRRIGLKIIKAAEMEENHVTLSKWIVEFSQQIGLKIENLRQPSTSFSVEKSPKKSKAILLNSSSAQRILKNARKSALKPSNKKVHDVSTSKNKKIVDYFPIVSISNGVAPLKNTSTRAAKSIHPTNSFSTPRMISKFGYTTEMSSADSDNGPITSGDEVEIVPTPKRRCARGSTRQVFDSNNSIDGYVHNDLVWTTLEDGIQLPGRVIDPRMRIMLGDDEVPLLNKTMASRPDHGDHTLVALFDPTNTWKWLPTKKLKMFDPLREYSNSTPNLNSALRKAKQFWNNVVH